MEKTYSEELLKLVEEFCTIEDIHGLLKDFEGHKAVKLTAPNKPILVNKNLRDALDARALPVERLYALVQEAEENGRQHIFYYVPASKDAGKVSLDDVGVRLWGRDWREARTFPVFDLVPNGFVFSDLRVWDQRRKPRDWILKIYGEELIEEQSGGDERLDERTIRRTYVLQQKRLVCCVRWNSPGILEVRIPEADSRRRLKRWLDQVWEMIKPVFGYDEFYPWNLTPARCALITKHKENEKLYRFSHSRLEDEEHNTVSYSSAHPDRDLAASAYMGESIRRLVKGGNAHCTHLRVTWLASDPVPISDLVSYLGDREVNEIVVRRRGTAREIEYVTDQLRAFSAAGTGASAGNS